MDFLHAIHKESCWEVIETPLRESGVLATLWTGEWLAKALPEGELMEALLAVVMAAREHLGLSVVIVADATHDLFLQVLHSFLDYTIRISRPDQIEDIPAQNLGR